MKKKFNFLFELINVKQPKQLIFTIKNFSDKRILEDNIIEGEMSEGVRKILNENKDKLNLNSNKIDTNLNNISNMNTSNNIILNVQNLKTMIDKFKFNNEYENFYLSYIKQFHKHLPLILLFLEYYVSFLVSDIKVKSVSYIDYLKKTTNKTEENHNYVTIEDFNQSNLSNVLKKNSNNIENSYIFDPSFKNMSHLRSNLKNSIIVYDIVNFVNEEINSSTDPFLVLSFIESVYKLKNLGAFIDLDNKNKHVANKKNNFLTFFSYKEKDDETHINNKNQKINLEFLFNSFILKIQMFILNNNFLRKISFSHYYLILNIFSIYFKNSDGTIDSEEVFEKIEYEIILFIKEKYKTSIEEASSKTNVESKMDKKIYSINEFLLRSSMLTSVWLFKDNFIEIFLLIAKNLEGSKLFYEYFSHMLSSHIKAIFMHSFLIDDTISNLANQNQTHSTNSVISEYFELKLSEDDKKTKFKKKKFIQQRNLMIEIYYSYVLINEHVFSNKLFENMLSNIEVLIEKNMDFIQIYFSNIDINSNLDESINDKSLAEHKYKDFISNVFIEKKKLNKEILEWSINRREKFSIENKLKSIII